MAYDIAVNIGLSCAFIFILFADLASSGQMCLSCRGVILPEECTVVTKCGDHEECYVEEYSNFAGHLRYNLGCKASFNCMQSSKRDQVRRADVLEDSPFVGCLECCNGSSLCNNGGLCRTKPFNYHNGNLCYTCDQQQSPDDCNSISLCSQDEVVGRKSPMFTLSGFYAEIHVMCYIGVEQASTSRHIYWTTKCLHKSSCDGISGMHGVASQFCHDCCWGNLCNNVCNKNRNGTATSPTSKVPDLSGKIAVTVPMDRCVDKNVLCVDMKTSCADHKEIRSRCPLTCGICSTSYQTTVSITSTPTTTILPSTAHITAAQEKRCLDHDTLCRYLKSSCQNSQRIKEQCPLTCGVCNNDRSCADHDEFCSLASSGCSKDPNVRHLCPLTCGLCSAQGTSQFTRTVPTTPPRHATLHVPSMTTELSTPVESTTQTTAATTTTTTATTTTTTTLPPTTITTMTTTTPPPTTTGVCKDKEDCTFYLRAEICPRSSENNDFARANCTAYCNYCPGSPTSFPCVDAKANCAQYESAMCSDMKYRLFAERYCLKFCNLCQTIQH